jgi:hypothetical protein
VRWVKGEQPVFCAIGGNGSALLSSKPAGNHQLTQTLASVGLMAGLLTPVRSHDLRRGSAKDLAHLGVRIKGIATDEVAAGLGHSKASHARGVTTKYVGAIDDDLWAKRVDASFEKPFGIEITDTSYRKRRRLTGADVTDLCKIDSLDPSDRHARRRVGVAYKKKGVNDWMQEQQSRADPIVKRHGSERSGKPCPFFLLDPTGRRWDVDRKTVLSPQTPSQINAGSSPFPASSSLHSGVSDGESGHSKGGKEPDSEEEVPVDPQLMASGSNLASFLAGSDDATMTTEMETACFDQVQNPALVISTITSAPIEFLRRFSSINVTCNQSLVPGGSNRYRHRIELYKGTSRDEPTFFEYQCVNAVFRCPYKASLRVYLYEHETTCKYTSIEAADKLHEKKNFVCTREGCESSFDTKGKLNLHVKEMHDWQPVSCQKEGCDPNIVYTTRRQHQMHVEKMHTAFKPTRCLFPGCTSNTTFQRSPVYRHHLQTVHKVFGKDKEQYLPMAKKIPFTARRCPVKGCQYKQTFAQPGRLRTHLNDVHDLDNDTIDEYVK